MDFELVKADKDLFAIYYTMYSNADIEMWYDWERRLRDTKWTDQCFFLMSNKQKVGGVIITDKKISYPFMVSPFCKRLEFWSYITNNNPNKGIRGVLEADVKPLNSLGFKTESINQVMCRPADIMECSLPSGFTAEVFEPTGDLMEAANVILKSYADTICEEVNGENTIESVLEDMNDIFDIYSPKNLSQLIRETQTGKIVAVCMAGVGKKYVLGYTEIADICVLPEYRNRGLAKYLLDSTISLAYGVSPFVKLFVNVGNYAEELYKKVGFIAGPRFYNLEK